MMDEEIRQALNEVREMKQMCGNINMKLTNIVTQRGQDFKKKLEAEYQKGFEDGKAVNNKGCEGCMYQDNTIEHHPCGVCCNAYNNRWKAKQTDDKIEVGDEVKPFYTDITGVVTLIDGDTIYVLWRDGSSTSTLKLKEVTKTGRHFNIATILEDMRND